MGFFSKMFGSYSDRELKSIYPIVDKIEAMADEYKAMSDAELQAKTPEFKTRLQSGETLDDILPEAFAAVREAYTGPDADWSRPCYSPRFADLRGLPPTLVQVGTNEILKSDSERLVENLQKAGVYAQLEVYPECWHVFQQMPIRRAAVAMESAGRFVQRII